MSAPRNTASPNPLSLAVIRHKLHAVAEEVVDTMIRTSFSPLMNQSYDFSAVVLDGKCRLLTQAERVPIHMGAIPFAMRAMADAFEGDVKPGDVLMANDPYWGGSHIPDITLAMPVWREDAIRFWVAVRAHHGDVGGMSAGGYSPGAKEIFHEGIRIPPIKLVHAGRIDENLVRLIATNTRQPEDFTGDLMAQLSAVRVGEMRLAGLFERYTVDEVESCSEGILDAGEASMRAQLRRWKPGTYKAEAFMDDDGFGNDRIPIRATVTIGDGEAVVDLSESSDQVKSFINSPLANSSSSVNVAFLYMSDDQAAQNDGSMRAIKVITRKGSICDPHHPAPVTGSTTLSATVIIEAVLRALAQAAPEQAMAGFARRFRFAMAGKDRNGKPFIWHYFSNRGGAGGNAENDGWPNLGVLHNPGGSPSPSVERTELTYPMVVEEYSLRQDSGGAGRRRGGLGGVYKLRYEGSEPAVMNLAGEGVKVPPHGLAGGREAAVHDYALLREGKLLPLGTKENGVALLPGDVVVCQSAGGGGHGDPGEREPERLASDVANGYVSAEAAQRDYGAVAAE
ncbi:MAG: hydantoinase B/oxoprolinase family protein [Alphaproteobacteria bacterium]